MAVFFLLLNLSVGVIAQGPVGQDLGINEQVDGDDKVESAQSASDKVQQGGGADDDTLFGLYNAVTNSIRTITDVLTAGPTMLDQLGFPDGIVNMLKIVMGVIYALGIASFVRGFNL